MIIGLLMVNHENDILERTLELNGHVVDCFYALDGTRPNTVSRTIITDHPKCAGYWTDLALPRPPYPDRSTDGYRQWLLEHAVDDHGPDNWFVLLHADEVWTVHPRTLDIGNADGVIFPLPFFFPRAGELWTNEHPLDQLHWNLRPGWPEFRMFRGNPTVAYHPTQHFNVRPMGIQHVTTTHHPILHYPYRSPVVQRERAAVHARTGFDPDNYLHILEHDSVYWTDDMIIERMQKPEFSILEDTWPW